MGGRKKQQQENAPNRSDATRTSLHAAVGQSAADAVGIAEQGNAENRAMQQKGSSEASPQTQDARLEDGLAELAERPREENLT